MYEISWPNLHMLSASIPSYDDEKNKTVKGQKQATAPVPEVIRTAEQIQDFFKF